MLYLSGHHRVRHALLVQQIDRATELAQAHPVQPPRHAGQVRRSLFTKRDDRHLNALAARRLKHQKGKPSVACDESPAVRRSFRGHIVYGRIGGRIH